MVEQKVLNDLFAAFPDAIMNRNLEFVADPHRRVNSYFRLDNCETRTDCGMPLLISSAPGFPILPPTAETAARNVLTAGAGAKRIPAPVRDSIPPENRNPGSDDFDRAYRFAIKSKMGYGFKTNTKTGFKIDVYGRGWCKEDPGTCKGFNPTGERKYNG